MFSVQKNLKSPCITGSEVSLYFVVNEVLETVDLFPIYLPNGAGLRGKR